MEVEIGTGIAVVSTALGYAGRAASDYIKRRANLEDKFLSRIEALEVKLETKDRVIDELQSQVHALELKVSQLEGERDRLLQAGLQAGREGIANAAGPAGA